MKAKLETTELPNPGVELESETEEEADMLFRLWADKGKLVEFTRLHTGIQLSIAPTVIVLNEGEG
uniref:Uncharacterized protein n=1 Tax=viral metagenome TaxID=1070528 RepID=A0A6M3LNX9_9ZZZZ